MNMLLSAIQSWVGKLDKTFIQSGHYKMIIEGLGNTVKITLGALVIGVLIGLIIAVILCAITMVSVAASAVTTGGGSSSCC